MCKLTFVVGSHLSSAFGTAFQGHVLHVNTNVRCEHYHLLLENTSAGIRSEHKH